MAMVWLLDERLRSTEAKFMKHPNPTRRAPSGEYSLELPTPRVRFFCAWHYRVFVWKAESNHRQFSTVVRRLIASAHSAQERRRARMAERLCVLPPMISRRTASHSAAHCCHFRFDSLDGAAPNSKASRDLGYSHVAPDKHIADCAFLFCRDGRTTESLSFGASAVQASVASAL